MNLENVTREDWIVGGLALLLVIALLFFPWLDISLGPFSATFAATGAPDGWLGVLAMIAALAVIADLAVERLSPQTKVPEIAGSRPSTRFILAAIAAAFVVLKFVFHIHFSLFGWGFYLTVLVTAALLFFAHQARAAAPLGTGTGGTAGLGGPGAGATAGRGAGTAGPGAPPPPPPTSPPGSSGTGGSAPPPPGV